MKNDWLNQHAWFKETVEKFDRVFRERIKNLDPSDWNPDAQSKKTKKKKKQSVQACLRAPTK